ncbi:hypothetical protein J7T55_015442 [Diaporthe amygdali]|uniref:uncharacterized protein n=1 Tax=Phomopsis amygdali TaxID=1214568 RepID=UPI0022FF2715|nr:uncharacterized protein J7T55_015442 [Diaporthe amygdali]KAJ0120710.1 hypothetical protein J7T55_015442 [Diaporthe amygdali]
MTDSMAAHTFKAIPDLEALGYDVHGSTPNSGDWVSSVGRGAADLLGIKYLDVYEEQLSEVTHQVYDLMGESEAQDLIIFRNHHSDEKEETYNLLHDNTPFGAGAQKMIDEFAEMQGKYIVAFGYEAQASGVFVFTIYFWI